MNYTQQAIEKSYKGGYAEFGSIEAMFIAPSFWQALLKITKWPEGWEYYMSVYSMFKDEFSPETQFKQFFEVNEKR